MAGMFGEVTPVQNTLLDLAQPSAIPSFLTCAPHAYVAVTFPGLWINRARSAAARTYAPVQETTAVSLYRTLIPNGKNEGIAEGAAVS